MLGEDRRPRVEIIPAARVRAREFSARAPGSDAEIRRLASSIRKHGLLNPLLVRPAGRDYEVVCGQRRWQACRALGLGEVVAVVRPLDDRQAFEISLAENARREALTADERTDILRRLVALFPGRTKEELETWLGPIEAADGLPNWLEKLPVGEPDSGNVSVVMAGEQRPMLVIPVAPPSGSPSGPVSVSSGPGSSDTKVLVNPDEDPSSPALVVGAGRRPTLVKRVRVLLNKLGKSGRLDSAMLREIVDELMHRIDHTPLPDFLDLSYRARTRRYVTRHCLNVAKLSMFLARSLGMGPEEIREIAVCGLLHDVGMMKVKDEVFTKHAALDQEEWEQVKGHPVEGALLLTKEVMLRDVVARVALEHHEKPDGTGYPHGKKKNEIHLYARLINVIDCYGAMVSPRAHRLPLLPHQAMRVVMDDGAKGMLDWEIVQSFVRAMSIYPIGSYVRLEGGEIARVVRAQPEIPEKPVIAVVADAQRNLLRTPVEIDLAMTEPQPKFEPIPSPM